VSGMGVMDRRFSRASIPMKGDRCAMVTIRHGRHGSPVFPRSDTDEGRSVRAGRGSAEGDIGVLRPSGIRISG